MGGWVKRWVGWRTTRRLRDPSKQKTISIGLWREAREWFNKLVNCLLIGLVFCSLCCYYCHSPPGHVRTRQYWLHLLLMDFSDATFIFIYRKGSPSELCRVQSQSRREEHDSTCQFINWLSKLVVDQWGRREYLVIHLGLCPAVMTFHLIELWD